MVFASAVIAVFIIINLFDVFIVVHQTLMTAIFEVAARVSRTSHCEALNG